MATASSPTDSHIPPKFIIDVKNVFTGEQFEQLCRDNRETRMELTPQGGKWTEALTHSDPDVSIAANVVS